MKDLIFQSLRQYVYVVSFVSRLVQHRTWYPLVQAWLNIARRVRGILWFKLGSTSYVVSFGSSLAQHRKALTHCISPLRMNVRGQIGRDSSDVYAFGNDTSLYSDCSIRIYFSDGEGTVT